MEKRDIVIFLLELGELTIKHKIEISACGCCNSPWLVDPNGIKKLAEDLNWQGDFYEANILEVGRE